MKDIQASSLALIEICEHASIKMFTSQFLLKFIVFPIESLLTPLLINLNKISTGANAGQ